MGSLVQSEELEHALQEARQNLRYVHPVGRTARERCAVQKECGLLLEPYPDFFAAPEDLENLSVRAKMYRLIRTIAHQHPTWTFSHYSAAVVHGLQVPYALLDRVHVGVDARHNRRITSSVVQTHLVSADVTCSVSGIQVTSLLPTLFDCLRMTTFRYGLPIIDSALHHELTSVENMTGYIEDHGARKHGVGQARQTLRYADGRSENGGESTVQAIIIELGYLVPDLQREVIDPLNPSSTKRVDFYWQLPDGRVVILELDGFQKYRYAADGSPLTLEETQRVLANERRRESHINLTGATVLRLSYEEATDVEHLNSVLALVGIPRVAR